MKKFYSTTIAIFILLTSFAGPVNKVIVNDGAWNDASTWSLGHVPVDGETVLIEEDFTLVVDNNVKMATATLILNVYGTLHFVVGKLDLGPNSIVNVYTGGSITTKQGTPADRIEMGGNIMYSGSQGTIIGPVTLSLNEQIVLPVKFVAYNVARSSNGVSIQWSTTEEVNADKYVVERSEDGTNWKTVSHVAAIGKSVVLNHYSYTDKTPLSKTTYYRVKQVDADGDFIYTSIKSVKSETEAAIDVKVSANASKVVVELSKQIKGNVVVRFVSLSGQVVAQQVYNNPSGYVIINQSSLKGNFIVSITNGQDIKVAKQIML